jgi:energy-coupling factor transporter ATP-binding protein EcfA2
MYEKFNVVLGKNGSGKSTWLRELDRRWSGPDSCVRYITPERGGELRVDGNIETNRASRDDWFANTRRKNSYSQFRQSSVSEFRNLETLVLRSIEKELEVRSSQFSFDSEIGKINRLLDRIRLERADGAGFRVVHRVSGEGVDVSELSSGESELISLATEILYFSYLCKQTRYAESENWLLFDEPDVHLHPDLQYRLIELLVESLESAPAKVMIATHSTTIVSSLCELASHVNLGFRSTIEGGSEFSIVSSDIRAILPMFGAHPLSNVFNQVPPLILEGEDDERIWQSAVRSSGGRIRVYPCVAGDVQSINNFERSAAKIINSVYDNAIAYSLRDLDDADYLIEDIGPVVRMRLNCRSAENLLVTDDVLLELGTDWKSLQREMEKWLEENSDHSRFSELANFQAGGWQRRDYRLKNLRMLIVGLSGSNKPWEVAVGQAIAKLSSRNLSGKNSLQYFLGPKVIEALQLI